MRVMMTGGGTGGHVFPGMAIAEALRARRPDADLRWVGTATGLEARLGAGLGVPLTTLPVTPLQGRGIGERARAVGRAASACARAWRLIGRWRPDCVIGTGGYVAGPVTLMAALRRVPTMIQEQNGAPGLTNRLLGRVVRRICITHPDSARYFPRHKVVITGNPIRRRVMADFAAAPARAAGEFGLLVFGGSQGACAIDRAMLDAIPHLRPAVQLRVIHQIGRGADPEAVRAAYRSAGMRAEVVSFIEDIGRVYKLADLVVCRAGASSLAELAMTGRPAIVIPLPTAADDHQTANARPVGAAGGAIVWREAELTGARLAREILRLMAAPAELAAMARAMRGAARPDAAERIVDVLLRVLVP